MLAKHSDIRSWWDLEFFHKFAEKKKRTPKFIELLDCQKPNKQIKTLNTSKAKGLA